MDGGTSAPVPSEFGLDARPQNPGCKAPARPPSTAKVALQRVYANVNLGTPLMVAQAPGDASRWFVAQRDGHLVSFAAQSPAATPTAVANLPTVAGLAINTAGEGGFLGMAFHPRFAENGKLMVSWTTTGGANGMRSQIGVLTSPDHGASFTSYASILSFDQTTATNHKGGGLAFGNDGYLYASFGDGGAADDQFVNGQNRNGFFAKILRLDVDNVDNTGGQPYAIPADNPFRGGGGEPATYAWGLRNAFRFSIDRGTGEVWAGDVGQNHWEEIDRVKLGGNYGWPCREGANDYLINDPVRCPIKTGFIDPVVQHEHIPANSRSITGGVVYRGKAIPDFVGSYLYGDYVTQEIFILSYDTTTGAAASTPLVGAPAAPWVEFAEDNDGEVYALALNGQMYQLVAAQTSGPASFPQKLSQTGCVLASDPTQPAGGLIPYAPSSPLWSDGADKQRLFALPDGATITVGADGDFDLPIGAVALKTFSLGGKRIETRMLVRHDDGEWAGYTYEWLDDQSDALLLPASKSKAVGDKTWYYPSRSDCVRCHTEAAGRTLGLELGQLNADFVYESSNRIANQLKTLEHIGVLSAPLAASVDQLPRYPSPSSSSALPGTEADRARAYLHANCSFCHRPNGGGRGNMDLRYATPLAATMACNVLPEAGDLGVSGAALIAPGDAARSLIALRPQAVGANRMPPVGSSVVDTQSVQVLNSWINSLTGCP
jgi:uncharacterized repeat protein (TIGR03806 family)